MIRRTILSALLVALAPTAMAQDNYPSKPIRLVLPFTPSGSGSPLSHLLPDRLSAELGQPIINEQKVGAGGNIAASYVAKASPDGYTVFLATINILSINPTLYKNISFDPLKDFAPISMLATSQNMLVVNPELPVKELKDFSSYVQNTKENVSYGSSGIGSSIHLSGELFKKITGGAMEHVPYKGASEPRIDIIGNRLTFMFSDLGGVPMVLDGKLKALAVTGRQREPRLPDVPTMQELGYDQFLIEPWYALVAPAGTPDAIIKKWNAALSKVMAMPDVRESFVLAGLQVPETLGAQALDTRIRSELERWRPLIVETGMKVE